MLCDRAAPPDNWLPPAEKGCGLVSPRRRVRGGVRPAACARGGRLPRPPAAWPGTVPGLRDSRAGLPGAGPEGFLSGARGSSGSSGGHLIVCRCEQVSPCDGVASGLSPRGSDWGYLQRDSPHYHRMLTPCGRPGPYPIFVRLNVSGQDSMGHLHTWSMCLAGFRGVSLCRCSLGGPGHSASCLLPSDSVYSVMYPAGPQISGAEWRQ